MAGPNIYGELIRGQAENVAADPTAGVKGRILWDTVQLRLKVDNGTLILPILANDGKAVIGTSVTANNNVRLHRGGSGIFQFVLGGDTTTEGSLSTNLATITSQKLSGNLVTDYLDHTQIATPSNPAASVNRLYFKSDNSPYFLTSAGVEVQFATGSSVYSSSTEVSNLALAAAVAANALTISLKTKAGTDATGSDVVKVGMRNSTLTTGTYTQRSVTAALSVVVSSGSTLGLVSAQNEWIYVYAIDNAGTIELAVMGGANMVDEGVLVSTTAEGGAGAADSRYTLYSTTARANVPIRLIGRIRSNQATSGTYASAPTVIALAPFLATTYGEVYVDTGNGHGSTATKIRRFTNARINVGTAITYADSATAGGSFTINEEGVYTICYADYYTGGTTYFTVTINSSSLTTNASTLTFANGRRLGANTSAASVVLVTTWTGRLIPGDIVRAQDNGLCDATAFAEFSIVKTNV